MTKNQQIILGFLMILIPVIAGLTYSIYKIFEKGDLISICIGLGLVSILYGSFLVSINQPKQ